MEKILEDLSFDADERSGETVLIDEKLIDGKLGDLIENEDVTRYIL
jgi:ATP-dependent HslUV protease ATP-binding subunit HslU